MVVICVFGDVNWGGLEKGICNLCAQGGVGGVDCLVRCLWLVYPCFRSLVCMYLESLKTLFHVRVRSIYFYLSVLAVCEKESFKGLFSNHYVKILHECTSQ